MLTQEQTDKLREVIQAIDDHRDMVATGDGHRHPTAFDDNHSHIATQTPTQNLKFSRLGNGILNGGMVV